LILIILVLVAAVFLIVYTIIYVKRYRKASPREVIETQTEYTPPESF
jgi:uncharacterized membrane protein YqiK